MDHAFYVLVVMLPSSSDGSRLIGSKTCLTGMLVVVACNHLPPVRFNALRFLGSVWTTDDSTLPRIILISLSVIPY